jgi:hypothetical protein
MTRYNKTLLSLLIPLLISISGCLEEKVKTTINSDGSCQRMISMKLQSKSLPERAFPLPGTGWLVEWRESGDTSLPYEYAATKTFNTPEELHNEYLTDSLTKAMRIDVVIQKRFRWFFTYLDYRETYFYQNPYGRVPISNYLTPEEITRYQQSEKNDTLDAKVQSWIERDQFEEFYAHLVGEAQRTNDPAIPASLLRENKERFSYLLTRYDSVSKAKNNIIDKTLPEDQIMLTIFNNVARDIFGEPVAEKLHPTVINIVSTIQAKEKMTAFPDTWEYNTIMTGLLLESNSSSIQGNSVTWKFTPNQVKVAPFEMRASSRVVNVWAFIVSAAFLLLLVLTFVIAGIRRMGNHSSPMI